MTIAAQAKIANPDLTPTREYVTLIRAIESAIAFVDAQKSFVTVASLPTASTVPGARYIVTDANATTFMSTVAAGGSNIVPVFSNGTNWKIG